MTIAQFNEGLKTIATLAFVFVCICVGIVLIHANGTLTKFDATLNQANNEIKQAEITRKGVDDLLQQVTTLVIDADNTESKESGMLDSWNAQVTSTLTNVNNLVATTTTNENTVVQHSMQTLDATTATIAGVQPVLKDMQPVLVSADTSLKQINKTLSNPDVPVILTKTKETMTSVASVTKDGADEVHNLLHPAKKTGVRATVNAVILYLDHLLPPIF